MIEWTKLYIQSKDAFLKEIQNLSQNEEWHLIANLKNGTRRLYLAQEHLNTEILLPKLGTEPVFVIVNNSKQSFNELVDHWNELKTFPKLCIVFVNPDSDLEKKWLIYPYTHDRISDPQSLKLGLKTLFETVRETK